MRYLGVMIQNLNKDFRHIKRRGDGWHYCMCVGGKYAGINVDSVDDAVWGILEAKVGVTDAEIILISAKWLSAEVSARLAREDVEAYGRSIKCVIR